MKDYLMYLIKRNRNLLFLLIGVFLIAHTLTVFTFPDNWMYDIKLIDLKTLTIGAIITLVILVNLIVLVIHRSLMKVASCDMYYALPLAKQKQTLVITMYGWILIFIPFLLSSVLTILFAPLPSNIRHGLIPLYLSLLIIMSAYYLFNTLLVLKCNSTKDAVIILAMYAVIFWFVLTRIDLFIMQNTFGGTANLLSDSFFNLIPSLISPFAMLIYQNLSSFNETKTIIALIAYVVYAIVFVYFIIRIAKNRKGEDAGAITTSKITYPFALSAIIVILLSTSLTTYADMTRLMSLYVFLFVGYIGVNFIAQRNFQFKARHIIVFVISILVSFGLRFVYVTSDGFGNSVAFRNIEPEKIESIYYLDYNRVNDDKSEIQVDAKNCNEAYKASMEIQEMLFVSFKRNALSFYSKPRVENGVITIMLIDENNDNSQYYYTFTDTESAEIKEILEKYRLI